MNPHPKFRNIIVVDANFLLVPVQHKINFWGDLQYRLEGGTQFLIYQQVLDELEAKKQRQKNKDKFQRQLRASLSYFDEVKDQYPIEIQYVAKKKKAQPIDDFLVEQCTHLKDKYEQKQIYLATNDYNLRRRARKAEINQIYVKQKKYLQIG